MLAIRLGPFAAVVHVIVARWRLFTHWGAKRKQQAARRQASAQATHIREYERARKEAERARDRSAKAAAADQKAMEKELARLLVEERLAEVESLNADLEAVYEEIDSMLAATVSAR